MSESEGQISEVNRLDEGDADTPISPADATAGYPPSESGQPDTRGSGPDAAPPENRHDDRLAQRATEADEHDTGSDAGGPTAGIEDE